MLEEHNYVIHHSQQRSEHSSTQRPKPSPSPAKESGVTFPNPASQKFPKIHQKGPPPTGFVAMRLAPTKVQRSPAPPPTPVAVSMESAMGVPGGPVTTGCIICTRHILATKVFGHRANSFSPFLSKLMFPLTRNITKTYEDLRTDLQDRDICQSCRKGLSSSTKLQQQLGVVSHEDRVNMLLEPLTMLETTIMNLRNTLINLLTMGISEIESGTEEITERNGENNHEDEGDYELVVIDDDDSSAVSTAEKSSNTLMSLPNDEFAAADDIVITESAGEIAKEEPSILHGLMLQDINVSRYYKSVTAQRPQTEGMEKQQKNAKSKIDTEQIQVEMEVFVASGDPPFPCPVCKQLFYSKPHLQSHMAFHGKDLRVECGICKKTFYHKSTLSSHMKRHAVVRAHQCSTCDKRFATNYELKSHMKSHEKPPVIKRGAKVSAPKKTLHECPICKKNLSSAQHLTAHLRIHTNDKPYECNLCHQKFRHNSSLFLHKKRHEGDLRYSCSICQRKFVCNYKRKVHEETHIPIPDRVRDITCEFCPKTFTSKAHYVMHTRRIHPESVDPQKYPVDKLLTCDVCGKKFISLRYLEQHLVQHFPERKQEAICDICGRGLTHIYSLRRHMRDVHEKVPGTVAPKVIPCTICGKKFTTRGGMKRHAKDMHEPTLPRVPCEICGKLLRPGNMRVHMRIHQRGDDHRAKGKSRQNTGLKDPLALDGEDSYEDGGYIESTDSHSEDD